MTLLNNMLQDVFDFAMDIEQREIKDYFDRSKKYSVLFRLNSLRNSSSLKNSPEEFVSIYYKFGIGIRQGQLLNLFDNGDVYLVLNVATAENSVYLKSDLAKCTTKVIVPVTEQNGISEKYIVPAYVENRLTQDKAKWIMTELSGVYQVFTTINEDTRNKIKLGTYVHVMDMSCKVLEKYTIYDMFCLVLTRTATLQGIDVTDTMNEPSKILPNLLHQHQIYSVRSPIRKNQKLKQDTVKNLLLFFKTRMTVCCRGFQQSGNIRW